jgi:hypothetical protein
MQHNEAGKLKFYFINHKCVQITFHSLRVSSFEAVATVTLSVPGYYHRIANQWQIAELATKT